MEKDQETHCESRSCSFGYFRHYIPSCIGSDEFGTIAAAGHLDISLQVSLDDLSTIINYLIPEKRKTF